MFNFKKFKCLCRRITTKSNHRSMKLMAVACLFITCWRLTNLSLRWNRVYEHYSNETVPDRTNSAWPTQWELNIDHLVVRDAPTYFKRYCVITNKVKYVSYRKNRNTTWYAFFEEYDDTISVVYLNNNHIIGHLLEIELYNSK